MYLMQKLSIKKGMNLNYFLMKQVLCFFQDSIFVVGLRIVHSPEAFGYKQKTQYHWWMLFFKSCIPVSSFKLEVLMKDYLKGRC